GGLGPKLLRLAHADAISYSIRSGRTGGMRGTLKLYSNSSLPPGLSAIMPFLEDYKILHPKASYADIWAYAASVAISESRGPAVPYRCGRKDLNATQFTPAPSLQPQGTWNASQIRARYSDMGLTDNETMAIFAMRGMGRMHPDVSGYDGRTTPFSLFITNAYFIQLTRMTTFVYSSSAKQWVNSASKTAMMPSDMSLMNDTSFQGAVQRYAANATLMFTDFVPAFVKLLELG
ncbi:heme peroxidase, partial [Gonapodya prolifera JEL478]